MGGAGAMLGVVGMQMRVFTACWQAVRWF